MPNLAEFLGQVRDTNVNADLGGLAAAQEKEAARKREMQNQLQMLEQLRQQNPQSNVNVEGISVSARDPLHDLLRKQQIEDTQEDRELRRQERYAKQVVPVTEQVSGLQQVEKSLPAEGEDFKSVGGFKSMVPTWAMSMGESLGIAPKGATQERQDIDYLKMLVRHPFFGSALTKQEVQAFESALGSPVGANKQTIQHTLDKMRDMTSNKLQSIEAGYPERTRKAVQAGGVPTSQQVSQLFQSKKSTAMPTATNTAPMTFNQWKAKKTQGQ